MHWSRQAMVLFPLVAYPSLELHWYVAICSESPDDMLIVDMVVVARDTEGGGPHAKHPVKMSDITQISGVQIR